MRQQTLEKLRAAEEIHYGVNWFISSRNLKGNKRFLRIDGRVCNALVNQGILVRVPGHPTLYQLKEDNGA